jgi:hypothetical protein
MDRYLPPNATLAPEILQIMIKGLFTLREMELKETYRLMFGSTGSRSCSQSMSSCISHKATGPGVSEAHQKIADRITDSAHSGTRLLQVLSLRGVCGGDCVGFCQSCVEGWEVGHADMRKNACAMLPDVSGLKGRVESSMSSTVYEFLILSVSLFDIYPATSLVFLGLICLFRRQPSVPSPIVGPCTRHTFIVAQPRSDLVVITASSPLLRRFAVCIALLVRRHTTKSHQRSNTGWGMELPNNLRPPMIYLHVLEVLARTVSDDGNIQDKGGLFSAKYS